MENDNFKHRYIPVQLLGINDFHGQINTTRTIGGQKAGGAEYLAAYLKQREAENKNTLLVNAGDSVGASAPASALLQDEPTIEIFNELGFDVGTVGNHEFDEGVDEMLRLIYGGAHDTTGNFEGADFPYTAANVISKETGKPILPPYVIKKVNGMPIGFIGVVTTETPSIVIPSGVKDVEFIDEAEAVNKAAEELKARGIEAIVVLSHVPGESGIDGSHASGEVIDMANKVDDEVDVIFGGHNHGFINTVVDNKLIVQSYSYGTAFSDVDLMIDPKTKDIVEKEAEIVTTFHDGIEPDARVLEMVMNYEEEVGPLIEETVGVASEPITRDELEENGGETPLGNLIADAQRDAMGTDFAFMNPGGIRANIDEGTITWGELYTVQPFNNTLVSMNLTGDQIKQLLEQQWRDGSEKILQISGLTYTWDPSADIGDKVVSIKKGENEIEPNEVYSVTVNSFLSSGGDGFTVLTEGTEQTTGPVDLDALVDYIEQMEQPISGPTDDRIKMK
ncbi:bifunctional metallophosphatase/5'-nucleotidase [Pseudalkalibacillus caeni]|uniref:bifunctional metallophosphatase/5'-nucleotidase n=1 Tax=Exobacillus caeni TaxID=2574798 RepID=UPI00248283B2|nr:5'-nucleotidase C-terminal domain-containing protein [Pseudalkalibacillus caeni]